MTTFLVNGVRLFARLSGTGPGVVYVHGGFATLGRWLHPQTSADAAWKRELTAEYRLLSYDRRGCEHSALPSGGYDPEEQARDLVELIRQLDLGPVHLFASSAGGPIAIVAAAEHPELVRTLTLQGCAARIVRPGDGICEPVRAAVSCLEQAGPEAAYEHRPPGSETGLDSAWNRRQAKADGRLTQYLADEQALIARAAGLPHDVRTQRYVAEIRNIAAYDGFDATEWARRVVAPALVLHGSNDRIFRPADGRRLADAIPRAQFTELIGAGHTPVFTDPAAGALFQRFLADHTH